MRALRLSVFFLCALGAGALAQPAPGPRAARPAVRPKPGKLDVPRASAELVGADLAVAAKAAQALAGSTVEAAHDAVLGALVTGLHPDVATAALAALEPTATKTDLAVVQTFLHHRNPAVRAAALRTFLRSMGDLATVAEGLRSFDAPVRQVAAEAAGRMKLTETIPALLILLDRGEDTAAVALGQMAGEDLARTIAEHFGTAPDAAMAKALGTMLARPDFGTEPVRLEVVLTVIKLAGPEATNVLEAYVKATPATPRKQSRVEAEAALKKRLGGDQ